MNHTAPQPGAPLNRGPSAYSSVPGSLRESQVNLTELLRAVRRRKWIILAVFWLCTGLAAVYAFTAEPEYEASSVLLVHSNRSSALDDLSYTTDGLGLLNEIEVLRQSIPLAERVAQRLVEIGVTPQGGVPLPILLDAEGQPYPVEAIARRLQSKRVTFVPAADRVSMIRVTVQSPLAEEASLIANVYAAEYRALNQESSRASITASRQFLREQESRYRSALDSSEARLESFMKREGAVALSTESTLLVQRSAELDTEIEQARVNLGLERASLDALVNELDRIEPGLASRIASGVEDEFTVLQKRIADLKAQANEFYANDPSLRGNESANPDLASIYSKTQQFQAELDRLSRDYVSETLSLGVADVSVGGQGLNYVASLKRQIVEKSITLRGLEAKLEVLLQRVGQYDTRLRDLPRKSIQFAQLQREKKAIEDIYLLLGEKAQEARVAEESELGYVDVVRQAVTPLEPVRPQRRMTILLGMLVGLVFGLGLALVRQAMDHRIYQPDDLSRLGMNVIGVVPRFDQMVRAEFGNQTHVEMDGLRINSSLIALLNPLSPVTECYRGIHTSLQFAVPDKVVETVLVTSSLPEDGKTVTSTNLAVIVAHSGRRTLYVDADLRRPRGHDMLGLERKPGLSDLLLSRDYFDPEAWYTGIENLYALPAGRPVPNPAEMIGSKQMRTLIAHLRQAFDVIIFDSAPLLLATDAMLLATQCDAALLVVASGKTEEAAVRRTQHQLQSVGAPLVGAVLNRFDTKGAAGVGYDYGYGYGYRYRYGYSYYGYDEAGKGNRWFGRKA